MNRVAAGRQRVRAGVLSFAFTLAVGSPHRVGAQSSRACSGDGAISTLVGAGLGAAFGAIPATIVHRHDQTSSHRIVAVSISTGALIGFFAAGRDHPCVTRADSSHLADPVLAGRSSHAARGAVVGALIGGVLGGVGSTFYSVGCGLDPCDMMHTRIGLAVFSAAEGAAAGGLLGTLVGWAWPARRH